MCPVPSYFRSFQQAEKVSFLSLEWGQNKYLVNTDDPWWLNLDKAGPADPKNGWKVSSTSSVPVKILLSNYIYNPRDFKYRVKHPLVFRCVCKNHTFVPITKHSVRISWPLGVSLKFAGHRLLKTNIRCNVMWFGLKLFSFRKILK